MYACTVEPYDVLTVKNALVNVVYLVTECAVCSLVVFKAYNVCTVERFVCRCAVGCVR